VGGGGGSMGAGLRDIDGGGKGVKRKRKERRG